MITIEFGPSRSSIYREALKLAANQPGYQLRDGIVRFTWTPAAIPLYKKIMSWRSVQIYIDGQLTSPDIIKTWFWCYLQRADKTEYCITGTPDEFFPWGCHQAKFLEFHSRSAWLTFGQLKKNVWHFDKPRIASYVNYHLFLYRFCPALAPAWIDSFLKQFPDSADPTKDPDWIYIRQNRMDPSSIIGAGPKDRSSAIKILKKIFKGATMKTLILIMIFAMFQFGFDVKRVDNPGRPIDRPAPDLYEVTTYKTVKDKAGNDIEVVDRKFNVSRQQLIEQKESLLKQIADDEIFVKDRMDRLKKELEEVEKLLNALP